MATKKQKNNKVKASKPVKGKPAKKK